MSTWKAYTLLSDLPQQPWILDIGYGPGAQTPALAKEFWTADYPAMQGVADNLRTIEACGYDCIGHFTLPESGWWNNYHTPLMERIHILRRKYGSRKIF